MSITLTFQLQRPLLKMWTDEAIEKFAGTLAGDIYAKGLFNYSFREASRMHGRGEKKFTITLSGIFCVNQEALNCFARGVTFWLAENNFYETAYMSQINSDRADDDRYIVTTSSFYPMRSRNEELLTMHDINVNDLPDTMKCDVSGDIIDTMVRLRTNPVAKYNENSLKRWTYMQNDPTDPTNRKKILPGDIYYDSSGTERINQYVRRRTEEVQVMRSWGLKDLAYPQLQMGLINAVCNQRIKDIEFFIRRMGDNAIRAINGGKLGGKTVLHMAVERGYTRAVQILLEAGARFDITDDAGKTVENYATGEIKEIINLVKITRATSLSGFSDIDKSIAVKYDILEKTDAHYGRALRIAAYQGNEDDIRYFLNKSVNINIAEDFSMRTPLHCAIQGKKRTAIKILLEAGAKTDIPDQAGKTAMDLVNTNPNDGLKEFILQTQLELMIAETQKKPAAASTQNSFSPPPLGD